MQPSSVIDVQQLVDRALSVARASGCANRVHERDPHSVFDSTDFHLGAPLTELRLRHGDALIDRSTRPFTKPDVSSLSSVGPAPPVLPREPLPATTRFEAQSSTRAPVPAAPASRVSAPSPSSPSSHPPHIPSPPPPSSLDTYTSHWRHALHQLASAQESAHCEASLARATLPVDTAHSHNSRSKPPDVRSQRASSSAAERRTAAATVVKAVNFTHVHRHVRWIAPRLLVDVDFAALPTTHVFDNEQGHQDRDNDHDDDDIRYVPVFEDLKKINGCAYMCVCSAAAHWRRLTLRRVWGRWENAASKRLNPVTKLFHFWTPV